ncbi:hypothetical protein FANTH_6608 [Fusarium anthophilum]|uniref:Uncharacterized protein n=1 Tax=Fusarium anthophilum TaxID=48485 RepID=A0A8H4ZI29_9HYPO|nr:hypothetical protein FANTH_6608 [Fusarium anthophilum]
MQTLFLQFPFSRFFLSSILLRCLVFCLHPKHPATSVSIVKSAPPPTSSISTTKHHRSHVQPHFCLRSQTQGHQESLARHVQPQKHPLVDSSKTPKQHLKEQKPRYQLCNNPTITITDVETGEEWEFVDHDELDGDLANSDYTRTLREELEINAREQDDLLYSQRWMN